MYRLMCLKCGNIQTPYDGNKGYCIICNCKMEQIPDGYGFSDEEIETFFLLVMWILMNIGNKMRNVFLTK